MIPYTTWQETIDMETRCYWCRCDLHEDNVYMYGTWGYGVCEEHQNRYQCEHCDEFVDGKARIFVGADGRPRSVCAPCYVDEREGHR